MENDSRKKSHELRRTLNSRGDPEHAEIGREESEGVDWAHGCASGDRRSPLQLLPEPCVLDPRLCGESRLQSVQPARVVVEDFLFDWIGDQIA